MRSILIPVLLAIILSAPTLTIAVSHEVAEIALVTMEITGMT